MSGKETGEITTQPNYGVNHNGTLPHSVEEHEGCIRTLSSTSSITLRLDGSTLTVEVMPLVIAGHQLVLGSLERRTINREFDGNGFVSTAQIGDWVSIHWGWACQVLSPRQVANLERWTRYHLEIVNETL